MKTVMMLSLINCLRGNRLLDSARRRVCARNLHATRDDLIPDNASRIVRRDGFACSYLRPLN